MRKKNQIGKIKRESEVGDSCGSAKNLWTMRRIYGEVAWSGRGGGEQCERREWDRPERNREESKTKVLKKSKSGGVATKSGP